MTSDTLTSTSLTTQPHTYPNGWRLARVGDVFRFTKKPRELQIAAYETIPFVPMEYIPIGETNFSSFQRRSIDELTSGTYIEDGDLLIAKITPSFENGKQGIIEGLPLPFGYATTEVISIKEIPGISDKRFLACYLLRTGVRSALAAKMEGSTGRQRLSSGTLANWEIMLPPLPEQRAIARVLRAAQNTITARRREVALERERKAALMQRLFTHGTRGEPTKQTEIGEMPASWQVVQLGTLCQNLQYGTSLRCASEPIGLPVLRIPNVIGGQIDTSDLKYLALSETEAQSLRLEQGELLFVRTNGRKEYTGRCAVFDGEPEQALFASYLIRAKIKRNLALPNFVRVYSETFAGRQQLGGRASNAADGKYNINTQTIRTTLTPLPPLDEQREITAILASCDAHIAALEREITLHDELFRALLEELMSGRLSALNVANGEELLSNAKTHQ